MHQKGFLDIELLYRLRQKESLKQVEMEIEDKIKDIDEQKEFYRTFERAFGGCIN